MALFQTQKKEKEEVKSEKKTGKLVAGNKTGGTKKNDGKEENVSVILRQRKTEKAALLAEKNAYSFEIAPEANKRQVAAAIQKTYGVVPVKIRTVSAMEKKTRRRGIKGVRRGNRKAIVFLKKGDKIEFI